MHRWREVLKESGEIAGLERIENLTDLAAGGVWCLDGGGCIAGFYCCVGGCDLGVGEG
jgi:hypothetical protein